jgi:HPt (histidine-containing phosphotransfer) domain-containing protein
MPDSLIDKSILDGLESRLGRDALLRIISAQIQYARQVVGQLDALAVTLDGEAVRRIAHQMAGSSASVGLSALGQTALKLETRFIHDGVATATTEDVMMLRDLTVASLAALTEVFPELL